MEHELLGEASEHLRKAAEAADGDVADRFESEADTLADAAEKERGPDHGWLDRHTHVIREAAGDAGGEAQEHAEAAVDSINEYREDVPGV